MPEYKRKPNTKCKICNKLIYRRPVEIKRNDGRVFCGQVCYGVFCRKENPCVICGKAILAGFNKKTCSRICANKHRVGIQYKINRPKDKVVHYRAIKLRLLEQRGTKCERCGYDRKEILQIHHVDRNRKNDKFDNLELICPNCHAEEHYFKNSWLSEKYNGGVAREV